MENMSILSDSPPELGKVHIVGNDGVPVRFFSNATQLIMAWSGFKDASDALSKLAFEVCAGTTPFGCQAPGSAAWTLLSLSGCLPAFALSSAEVYT